MPRHTKRHKYSNIGMNANHLKDSAFTSANVTECAGSTMPFRV